MILFASGDIRSCKYNAERIFNHSETLLDDMLNKLTKTDGTVKKDIDKIQMYNYVNVGLLLTKCLLIESSTVDVKDRVTGNLL